MAEQTSINSLIADAVSARVGRLKGMTRPELTALPPVSSEELSLDGTQLTLSVWHDLIGSSDHRVVVQAYKPGLLVGRMHAEGFVVDQRGEVRPLSKDERAPFT